MSDLTATPTAGPSKAAFWAGTAISTLLTLFLLMDAGMKVAQTQQVVEYTRKAGLRTDVLLPLGVTLLVSTLLYAIPQTAVLGAILLTGYFGGAIATHVHLNDGAFGIVFASAFGVLAWLGLFLREPRLRAILPWRA